MNKFILIMSIISSIASAKNSNLNVRLAHQWPVDPLNILTMGDYDLALCLTNNWFNYDESRIAKSGIIESWKFEKGTYTFTITEKARWSNGDSITPGDLEFNLKRAVSQSPTYGKAIAEIINLSSFTKVSDRIFKISTIGNSPKEAFFQRMGSIFLAITHPGNKLNHHITAGPYYYKETKNDLIILNKNKYYIGMFTGPETITVAKVNNSFSIDEFLSEKSFEDIVQLTSMMPPEIAQKISDKSLPMWSRAHDRVSLLKPLENSRKFANREILTGIAVAFKQKQFKTLSLNVTKAQSLQPLGYPLFSNLEIKGNPIILKNKKIVILASMGLSTTYHKNLLNPFFKENEIEVDWIEKNKQEFIKVLFSEDQKNFDFALFDFGVADPEPATWMALVLKKKMIESTEDDVNNYVRAVAETTKEQELRKLSLILKSAFERGSYLPLFHFSTMVLGKKYIDFSNIRKLDETINYSQLIIK